MAWPNRQALPPFNKHQGLDVFLVLLSSILFSKICSESWSHQVLQVLRRCRWRVQSLAFGKLAFGSSKWWFSIGQLAVNGGFSTSWLTCQRVPFVHETLLVVNDAISSTINQFQLDTENTIVCCILPFLLAWCTVVGIRETQKMDHSEQKRHATNTKTQTQLKNHNKPLVNHS